MGPSGARLTVPPRTPATQIDAFLRASTEWVDRQRRRTRSPSPLGSGDRLAYLDGELDLVVRITGGTRQSVVRIGSRLEVATGGSAAIDALVEAWYRRQAGELIEPRCEKIADRLGANVGRVSIRDTRSRWGSCSSAGTLSFSWRLLLAPEHVLDYVVAHEVCHLLQRDHSPAFWALVRETDPGAELARRWLRESGELLFAGPTWRSLRSLSPS